MEDIRMIGLRCADLGTRSSQGMTTLRPVLIATLRLELGAAAVFGAGAAGSIIGSKQCDGGGDFCGLAEAHRRHLRKQASPSTSTSVLGMPSFPNNGVSITPGRH
jgi:hypothetical protein